MIDQHYRFQSDVPMRLDQALAMLAAHIPISRRRIRTAIADGGVYVNQRRTHKAGMMLRGGEALRLVILEDDSSPAFTGQQLIWQQHTLFLIHKRSGQYAQEALHKSKGCIPDALATHLGFTPQQARLLRPVHRLDRDTSGLMLLSSSPQQLQHLQSLWHSHVHKSYIAWVSPAPAWEHQRITVPISKNKDRLGRFHVHAHGRACDTEAHVLLRQGNAACLQLIPHTGRTHQLRVHLAHIGCPIMGDRRYQGVRAARLMLHAKDLRLEPPAFHTTIQWSVEPEEDWICPT